MIPLLQYLALSSSQFIQDFKQEGQLFHSCSLHVHLSEVQNIYYSIIYSDLRQTRVC